MYATNQRPELSEDLCYFCQILSSKKIEDDIRRQLHKYKHKRILGQGHSTLLGLEARSMTKWKGNPAITDHFPSWPAIINQEADHSLKDALGSQGEVLGPGGQLWSCLPLLSVLCVYVCSELNPISQKFLSTQNLRMWPFLEIRSCRSN